mmetsp:Transcript_44536/g.110372  ORF Transcript_44536/g.110372 Transcript_44536/m.110372 type:complete len:372 (+) Transcript_44536:132-1247(+)
MKRTNGRDKPVKKAPKAAGKGTAPSTAASAGATAAPAGGIRKTVRDLLVITSVVGLPYAAYSAYTFAHLESGWLRPPVARHEPRQLLVVGSQASGTSQTAATLAKLGLEVKHEAADASTSFCRDGSVSWFHGIRFLEGEPSNKSLALLCSGPTGKMGFHPAAFRRSSCSYRKQWDACWERECKEVISESWGCAVTPGRTCEMPFEKTLLQARHPLRTMESLVVKFCQDETAPAEPLFLLYAYSLFAGPEWEVRGRHCLPVVGWYVLEYYEAMIKAVDAGEIDQVFKVESVGVCDVARMGGFAGAAYAPSREAFDDACGEHGSGPAAELSDNVLNKRNKGLVQINLSNLTAIDGELADRVVALGARLGYVIA